MFLLRINRKNVLKADDTYGEQSVSGWSALNAEMSSITLPRTVISGRLRPGSKSFMIFMYSFQKLWLKTSTRDDFW